MTSIRIPIALIALASTAALAQQAPDEGNIPAPDLFNDQILCSSSLPTMRPTPTRVLPGATDSVLDTAIGMGSTPITDRDVVNALGYVVPSAGSNCGQGENEDAFTVATQGSVATDVAEGYSALLPKFMAVYGDPDNAADSGTAGALGRAREALRLAEADDTTTESRLTALRTNVTRAEAADTRTRAEFNSITNGPVDDAAVNPIYASAVAEWMAQATVTQSLADYNSAVGSVTAARNAVDALNYNDYASLGNSELLDSVVLNVSGTPLVILTELFEYVNRDGNMVARANQDGVYDTSQSNFDEAGNLVVPNRLVDGELQTSTQTTSVADARSTLERYDTALAALKKLQADNRNTLTQPAIDEGVRRAQAERDHFQQQFRNALADDTNQNPVTVDVVGTPEDEAAAYSIASRNLAYVAAQGVRATAETVLRNAAAAREAATQNVVNQFQNPESFLAQLVARREALKTVADDAVADATTPSMALTDAATAAAEALTAAQTTQTTYEAVVGDPDGPIDDLVTALLDDDGDDGQALVDAISQTYGATRDNLEAIDALTADTDDGAEADGPVTANTKSIESLKGRVGQNEQDIEALQGETEMMSGRVATNAGNIATNAGNIVTNASFISQNAAGVAHNSARIDVNSYNIAQNSDRIGANAAAIGMNSGMILENRNIIGELGGQLDAMRGGVAASIAISRMPSVNGGISFGAGVYGGETALAVGFALDRKRTSFDFGVTSSNGEIGAGIGVGVKIWGD